MLTTCLCTLCIGVSSIGADLDTLMLKHRMKEESMSKKNKTEKKTKCWSKVFTSIQ